MEPSGARDRSEVEAVLNLPTGLGRPHKEVLDGLTYVADGRGFCPHPIMTRWLEETAIQTGAAQ